MHSVKLQKQFKFEFYSGTYEMVTLFSLRYSMYVAFDKRPTAPQLTVPMLVHPLNKTASDKKDKMPVLRCH